MQGVVPRHILPATKVDTLVVQACHLKHGIARDRFCGRYRGLAPVRVRVHARHIRIGITEDRRNRRRICHRHRWCYRRLGGNRRALEVQVVEEDRAVAVELKLHNVGKINARKRRQGYVHAHPGFRCYCQFVRCLGTVGADQVDVQRRGVRRPEVQVQTDQSRYVLRIGGEVRALVVKAGVFQRVVAGNVFLSDDRRLAPVGVVINIGDIRIRIAEQ